jgi:hypothetical protein
MGFTARARKSAGESESAADACAAAGESESAADTCRAAGELESAADTCGGAVTPAFAATVVVFFAAAVCKTEGEFSFVLESGVTGSDMFPP